MMPKPNLIVIGAMKCATSTVCEYFEDHPDVWMLARGEPRFFSHDEIYAEGEAAYCAKFADHTTERYIGEGSNDYAAMARYPKAAERMAAFNPDMKIVYMVRDPIARIKSDFIQRRVDSGDQIPPTLPEAVARHPEIFLDASRYWTQLQAYRAHFSDDQIFVGVMEDLSRDREAFLERLCGFLDITPLPFKQPHANPSAHKRVPTPLYTRLNSNPVVALAKSILPKSLRSHVKSSYLSQSAKEVAMDPALEAQLQSELADEARQILTFCGKPADFWTR